MKKSLSLLTAIIATGLISSVGSAGPSGGDFEIIKSTIDSGGGVSAGGDFTLTGTIGQHDASTTVSSGGDFSLAHGFWGRAGAERDNLIFIDGFEE